MDRDPELLSKNPQKSDFTFCDRVFRSNKWVRLRAGLCNEKPRNAKNDPKLSKLSKCCRTDTKMCNTVQVVSLVVLGLQESSSRWKMCPYSLESRITGISRKIFVSSILKNISFQSPVNSIEYEDWQFRGEVHVRHHTRDSNCNSSCVSTYIWPMLLHSPLQGGCGTQQSMSTFYEGCCSFICLSTRQQNNILICIHRLYVLNLILNKIYSSTGTHLNCILAQL